MVSSWGLCCSLRPLTPFSPQGTGHRTDPPIPTLPRPTDPRLDGDRIPDHCTLYYCRCPHIFFLTTHSIILVDLLYRALFYFLLSPPLIGDPHPHVVQLHHIRFPYHAVSRRPSVILKRWVCQCNLISLTVVVLTTSAKQNSL